MRQSQRGYSLPELLAVVIILGIAAAVAIPDISTTDPDQLNIAAEELAQAMRFARSEALRTGQPHGFRQQSSAKRIRVFRPDTSTAPWTLNYDVYHPVSKKLYDIDLNIHPFARVDSLSHNRVYRGVCNSGGNVYFDSSGIPRCADPETVLLEQFEVTLTLSGHSRTVTLHGITGRVTVQ
ncbi:MAG: prepilin-type N-terminal cleavage/methylation domain-containing protein [Gammaproteobacteria bacterium]|nr:prepilin-type N-terminal cleavage/methylation domain-containing protein [Gammaproteobacteria bacterium]